MPKRTDIKSILIIGAGPIIIGQACEFDYSGTQACKALREEGYRIILVNSNPATIMTDPDMADATYVEPISLTPDSVYARDKSLGGFGQDLNYKNSSMDTTDNILKYRFKHLFKADIEFKIYKFSVGLSYRYYSKMQNIDKAFSNIEQITADSPYLNQIKGVNFWKSHAFTEVYDVRISYKISDKQKLSLVCNNLLNTTYSLRPLKVESPRTTAIQYVLTF